MGSHFDAFMKLNLINPRKLERQLKTLGMTIRGNLNQGLLNRTITEFKKKGVISIEEIRNYLRTRYNLFVTAEVIKNRMTTL
jgi:hypothetical protein